MQRRKTDREREHRLGVHVSIAGGVSRAIERAADLGCNTIQMFSHNPRQWHRPRISPQEADRFIHLRSEHGIRPVFVHASYLINLASPTKSILEKSIRLLAYEMNNADAIGAEYVVLHTGSASGDDKNRARKRAVRALQKALSGGRFRAKILLENTAGERGDFTSSIGNLADIIDACHHDGIGGICIDTCHAFAAGYDLRKPAGIDRLLTDIEGYIGRGGLKLLHLNDSKRPFSSGVDRHEHIGRGRIGMQGFRNLFAEKRLQDVPMILETPKTSEDDDRRNLRRVRTMLLKTG